MLRTLAIFAVAAPMLSGCGFTPLYATTDSAGRPALQGVALAGIKASDTGKPIIERAFERRLARTQAGASYDLFVIVNEGAQPLAIQIDDSVTRFNYRMVGKYTLTERATGKALKGTAESVASFNVVSSQYSTLFAEKSAREKAARFLVEEIERDILVKFAAARTKNGKAAAALARQQ